MTGGGNLVRYDRYRKAPRTPRSAHARYYYTRSLVLDPPVKKPRTRCQSAPKIMESHSRSASPREPMRPQIRPPSPPSPAAFDNRAYQHDDESDPNHNESFTSNRPVSNGTQQNGHKPNGDTKLEAVNLELINLTPKNGTKKDTAVDMNASNPYDEYFVPVNEHRKFMRGEKLYVTADKRGEKGGCKRPLCWTLLALVVAAIVAVIVLAATGILFSGSPSPLEQYNTTVTSARAFGGVVSDHDHDHDHRDHDHSDHDHSDHDHSGHDHSGHDHSGHDTKPTQTQHGPETQNDQEIVHNDGSEENDMSVYVPRTLEGELKIDNEEYSPALADPESDEYHEFITSFSEALKRAIFDRNTLENGDNDVRVEVIQLRKGSVVVTYRIHWTPKPNAASSTTFLTADALEKRLDDYLGKNNRMINVYHVADEPEVKAKPVLDICQIDNNQCDHGCEFDETSLEFTCTCPHGHMLDMNNPKQCMTILENAYPLEPIGNKEQEFKEATVNSNPSTTKSIPDEETPAKEIMHVENEHFDWKETNPVIPETITESDANNLNFSHIFGHSDNEHKTETPILEPSAAPEPTAEPKAEPEPTSEPVVLDLGTKLADESLPEPTAEPAAEPTAEPAAEPTAEPTPEPVAEPTAEPATELSLEPTAEPAAEPAPEPTVEPTSEPTPEHEPTFEPKSAITAEPNSSENEKYLKVIPSQTTEAASELTSELEPEHEPTSEPEPEPILESETELKSESEAEQKSEPEAEQKPEPEAEQKFEPETEHKSELESELFSESEPTSEPTVSVDTTTIKVSITEAIPTSEPKPIPSKGSTKISEKKSNSDESNADVFRPSWTYDSSLYTNDEKYGSKLSEEIETSTARVFTSEPNTINDSSLETKPDIVSIYSKQNPAAVFVTRDNNETTTENEWFEGITTQNDKHSMNESNNSESEQRSFKSIDDFVEEPTTVKVETSSSNISSKENEKMEEVFTNAPTGNKEISTMKTNDNMEEPTERNNQAFTAEMPTDNKDERSTNLFTNENITTTLEPKVVQEHSIMQQTDKSDEEKRLMEALSQKHLSTLTEIITESSKPDEGLDITFDTINDLNGRSSKSIANQTVFKQLTTDTIMNSIVKATTTESDWLSESVTEVNYEEAMNKLEKHETTETPMGKLEEIINSGKTKDDFEPDYLNNMSSNNNNKMSEQDEPMYGLAQDYDSEDPRVKRVNTDKEVTTEAPLKVESNGTHKPLPTEAPMPLDAATVVEYIYKSTENLMGQSSTSNTIGGSSSTLTPLSEETKPAPVWEDTEGDLTVKELLKPKNTQEETTTARLVMIDDIVVPSEVTTTTATETMSSQTTESLPTLSTTNSSTSNGVQTVSNSDTESQNTTQVKNLNVNIYEISSLNNSSGAIKDANTQAADFEDHETEMNPFLPEAENNKFLVKKLQEGHDIEPNNFTETQNENTEEHSNVSEAITNQVFADNKATSTMTAPIATEEYTTFNELMKSSQENKTEGTKEVVGSLKSEENSSEHKETIPFSTFLLDTDDLDIGKDYIERKTTATVDILENAASTPTPITDDDSDYLSVVPIEEERSEEKNTLKKAYSSESLQELNDISDSPKKSDRRTLHETKFDSVHNNEA